MEWRRLTRVPVTAGPRACTVGPWSRCRWDMARLSRVLKPGCQLEPGRRQTEQR
jgi:hypothetical protein